MQIKDYKCKCGSMDKDGVVDAESYQKFILEHLSELRGEV